MASEKEEDQGFGFAQSDPRPKPYQIHGDWVEEKYVQIVHLQFGRSKRSLHERGIWQIECTVM